MKNFIVRYLIPAILIPAIIFGFPIVLGFVINSHSTPLLLGFIGLMCSGSAFCFYKFFKENNVA